MDKFHRNLVDHYLKTCTKLKKVEKALIKRFGPNLSEVLNEFTCLCMEFEEAAVYQYAAMCQLGIAKCEAYNHNYWAECQGILKAARLYLKAHEQCTNSLFRTKQCEYREAALHCFNQAIEKCSDEGVIKAAIIREIRSLIPNYEITSVFNSPAHRIFELEKSAEYCIKVKDFLKGLHHLDDIVDNIYERKTQHLYKNLLKGIEITRVLLLVLLSLPPARQMPAHIKLIEYYIQLAENMGNDKEPSQANSSTWQPGNFLLLPQKISLAEIVMSWYQKNLQDLKIYLQEFRQEFNSLTVTQKLLINYILEKQN